jgi:putative transposase
MKSIIFPQFKSNPLTGWQIQLPKLGKVPINLHRSIPEGFVIKQVRVVKKAVGWFAVIAIESDIAIPSPLPHGHSIGVDVGLLSYVATSDGYTEARPKFFLTAHRRLKVLQKRLSRKIKRGKNYEKARIKVAKQHNHIDFQRKDYQFKLAHKLCDMASTIFVEDCDFRIMAKGMLGKHTIDASFGQLRTILEYVGKKKLSDRYHVCHECGYEVDRDIASAQEICNRGQETYPGTLEKQEIVSQVVLSGAMCLDKWRGGEMPNSDVGKPIPTRTRRVQREV